MIVVTGAAGFIGSCLVSRLNQEGFSDIVIVDDFSCKTKLRNLSNKSTAGLVHREQFHAWVDQNHDRIDHIFHLGARTDTTEKTTEIFDVLNLNYSKSVWQQCCEYRIPLTYASSAATYGDGQKGYRDSHSLPSELKPLNPYGDSKNEFDKWALLQEDQPPQWIGFKFFNVYGPNEYHKGRMASVIFHAFNQIRQTGGMKLFRSHNPLYKDGHQSRDFIYVRDITEMCLYAFQHSCTSGLYNAGTGTSRTFLDLVKATFQAMDIDPVISYIDTPIDIRDTYQYYTEATMEKWKDTGYGHPFTSLEDGVTEYVQKFLSTASYL